MQDQDRLSERREAILQAVVEEFMATARPVGSGLVKGQADLKVSSATVRKELSALEEEGFLRQPHTSAGRVPTDKGYRYFVDALMGPTALGAAKSEQISAFFARAHGELERILYDTSGLLAGVTEYAAVVVAPGPEQATVRGAQLVRLDGDMAMLVVVLSTGGIERRMLELGADVSDRQIAEAQRQVVAKLVDGTALEASSDDVVAGIVTATLESFETPPDNPSRQVHVGGRAALPEAFDETSRVTDVLRLLERQLIVVSLLRDVLDRGLHVAIGAETGLQDLNDCSLVVAPYEVGGTAAGSIGVLGPTHMNYPEALAAVAVISNELSEHLTRD